MERYPLFQLVHKGLRAALYDTAWKLQKADFTQPAEAEEAISGVKEVLMLLDLHARREEEYVFPLLAPYEPSIIDRFVRDHQESRSLDNRLLALCAQHEEAASPLEQSCSGRNLTDVFIAFLVHNLNHLAAEAKTLQALLGRYCLKGEMEKTTAAIGQVTPAWMQDFYHKWMLRGMNRVETISWLRAVRRGAPAVVFQTLFSKAGQELPPKQFKQITTRLHEALPAAI
jgi:hypothetical protein